LPLIQNPQILKLLEFAYVFGAHLCSFRFLFATSRKVAGRP
jgi:hypothetical protein